jgi:hypothetical protein
MWHKTNNNKSHIVRGVNAKKMPYKYRENTGIKEKSIFTRRTCGGHTFLANIITFASRKSSQHVHHTP